MERSLHRVSLGSRRAHPGLSFYLTTFGKCPRRLPPGAASPCPQRPERATPSWWQVRRGAAILLFGDICPPWSRKRGSGHRLRPRKPLGPTCCLATDAKCSWLCLTWLEQSCPS